MNTTVEKVPKLRFKGYSDDWQRIHLGDITKINQGLQIAISARHVKKVPNSYFYITNEFLKDGAKKQYYIVDPPKSVIASADDLLMTRTGNTGVVVTGVAGAFHNNFFKIKLDKNKINKGFLYYFLTSKPIQNLILRLAGTSTIPDLNHSDFYKIPITLPSLDEQTSVGGVLATVDGSIMLARQKVDAMRKYKQSVMQALFSGKLRFKDQNGNNYPVWQKRILGEVFNQTKGSGISKDETVDNGTNKCILYGELYTTYSEVIHEIKSRTNLASGVKSKTGDLLVPCSTTTTGIDLANITELREEGVLLGGDITILRFNHSGCSTFFAYYLTHYKTKEIAKYAQGSTIVHLYYNHFKKMVIDVPVINEQQKIADLLSSIDDKINLTKKELEQADKFKKTLLQEMFV